MFQPSTDIPFRSIYLILLIYFHYVVYAVTSPSTRLSLSPVAPTLELRASVKRFVSLQFLNPKTVGRTPWMADQPVAKPLPTQTQTDVHAMSRVRTHDPSIRALDRADTVIAHQQASQTLIQKTEFSFYHLLP
jgi:hypothetical protein